MRRVEAGDITDPLGQYVAKSTQDDVTQGQRNQRPKYNATTRTLESIRAALAGHGNGQPASKTAPPDNPPTTCPDGTCPGTTVPAVSHFVTTEQAQPWNVPPGGGRTTSGNYFTAQNPNGYIYDLKIIKSTSSSQPPFNNNADYITIPADLNSGAGGQYIYLTFNRNPQTVKYQHNSTAACGVDEQPQNASNAVITDVAVHMDCCHGSVEKCFNHQMPLHTNVNGFYTPFWAMGSTYTPGDLFGDMKIPDLNDGAGGDYIYGWLSRTTTGYAIEVGVLYGNSDQMQPPAGWVRTNEDLNHGAGGDYIYLCVKQR